MPATWQTTSPVLTGHAGPLVDQFIRHAEQDIAQEGVNRVRARLHGLLKHPTGFYESRIATDMASSGYVVNDSGVVYGPWLEGVGSRNTRSRFKGYATFRKVAQDLERDAAQIAERRIPALVHELGG